TRKSSTDKACQTCGITSSTITPLETVLGVYNYDPNVEGVMLLAKDAMGAVGTRPSKSKVSTYLKNKTGGKADSDAINALYKLISSQGDCIRRFILNNTGCTGPDSGEQGNGSGPNGKCTTCGITKGDIKTQEEVLDAYNYGYDYQGVMVIVAQIIDSIGPDITSSKLKQFIQGKTDSEPNDDVVSGLLEMVKDKGSCITKAVKNQNYCTESTTNED
ncbi:hypothetical protein LPJ61_004182, partial [Coemansia biformis]